MAIISMQYVQGVLYKQQKSKVKTYFMFYIPSMI